MERWLTGDGRFDGDAIIAAYHEAIRTALADAEAIAHSHGDDGTDSYPADQVTSEPTTVEEISATRPEDFDGLVVVGYVRCANYLCDAVLLDPITGEFS